MKYPDKASWLEINAASLKQNIRIFRDLLDGQNTLGVVLKGNAYGHGLEIIYPLVRSLVDCIYLITPQDAFKVREIERLAKDSRKRIVVLGAVSGEEVVECAKQEIEVVIGDPGWEDYLPLLRKSRQTVKAHIHLDTGLAREGFCSSELESQLKFLQGQNEIINIIGVMSHFSNTEDTTEQSYARLQMKEFKGGTERVRHLLGIQSPLEQHFAASGAILVLPESRFNSVRVGISLFGFWPSPEIQVLAKKSLKATEMFKPVLSWKCRSQILKKVKKGSSVGYGCTYRCDQDIWIAVFPVGYYDGYPRALTGKSHVLINEKRCPVIGRVMMNHFIVDATAAVKEDSGQTEVEAILLGTSGNESITAEMVADWAQTIHYEIVTRLGSHLKRVVISTT